MRDLDLTNLRDKVAKNVSSEDIFEGTILDNIVVGKPQISTRDAVEAINLVGLADKINMLPNGLSTQIISGGKGFSSSFVHKLILARCLVKKPRLLILNDFFASFQRSEKENLLNVVTTAAECTLVAVSNDPMVMAACDRVIVMEAGTIIAEGTFTELLSEGYLNKIIKV
jgi:ABC-type multidrug transport system fused ATPase/permease subunit